MDEMMQRDDGMRRCLRAVEEKMGRAEKTLTAMLKQHGARGQTQAERVVDSVQHMRDEMMRMRVGQGEIARLVRQMGVGVGNVDSGLGGLGGTVRAIQRQLEARAKHEKQLAKSVSRLERAGAVMGQAVEEGMRQQQLSPPGSGGKQQGAGRGWVGRGELERKQLQFDEGHEGGGAGQRETEQEQQHDDFMKELDAVLAAYEKEDEQAAAMRAEKEREHEQEATRRAEEVAAAAVEAAALAAARYEERRVRWIERARRGEECLLEGNAVPRTSASGEPAMDVAWSCPCEACDEDVC